MGIRTGFWRLGRCSNWDECTSTSPAPGSRGARARRGARGRLAGAPGSRQGRRQGGTHPRYAASRRQRVACRGDLWNPDPSLVLRGIDRVFLAAALRAQPIGVPAGAVDAPRAGRRTDDPADRWRLGRPIVLVAHAGQGCGLGICAHPRVGEPDWSGGAPPRPASDPRSEPGHWLAAARRSLGARGRSRPAAREHRRV